MTVKLKRRQPMKMGKNLVLILTRQIVKTIAGDIKLKLTNLYTKIAGI